MIDFVAKYVSLVKAGLSLEKVPLKYRDAVIAYFETSDKTELG